MSEYYEDNWSWQYEEEPSASDGNYFRETNAGNTSEFIDSVVIPEFFNEVDKVEEDIKQSQIKKVVMYLVGTDNAHLIADNIDEFLVRMDNEVLARILVNNSKANILAYHIDKFDQEAVRAIAPGLVKEL